MASTGYIYNEKLWRACPTKADTNSFFHSAFGTRDQEGEELSDKQAHFRRMRWVTFLTYFASDTMPYGLADVLKKCFTASGKYRHASIDDKESFMKYVSDLIASERNVTTEEIPILATLENIKIVMFSSTRSDAAITIKPNPDILGSYPNVEKAKEEVVLCLEADTFSRLELVKDISVSDEIIIEDKIRKENASQSKNNTIRYKKGGSAGSKGVQYQIHLLAVVLLNAFKNLREWKLSTENEDAGKFDDIVLEETEGATFIQSKHKESGKKRITLSELTSINSKNDDFSLPKYFLSYLQIKTKFKIKNVILCTNADVHEKALKFLNRREPYFESALHYDDGDHCFYTLKEEILLDLKTNIRNYYQQNFQNKGVEESAINDENLRDFQKDLQLYFNYPSQNRFEKIVDTLLSRINTCHNSCGNITSEELYSKLMNWFQQKDGVYLTQIRAEATFLEILRDKYCRKLEQYKLTFQRNDFDFQGPKQVFRVACEGSYLLQVLKVYQSVKENISKMLLLSPDDGKEFQKRVAEVFELPLYSFLIIICPETVDESVTTEVCGKLSNILSTYKYKKIILITDDNNKLFQQIRLHNDIILVSGSVNLEDLHWVSQERLLKTKNIVFQGTNASLEEILGAATIEKYATALRTEILDQLIRGEVKVGVPLSKLDECVDQYYVSRTFRMIFDKTQEKGETFHSNKDADTRCAVDKEQGKIWSDDIKGEGSLAEVNICDVTQKVIVISNGAGMGKSTVLVKLAETIKENNPYLWVIRVELNNYTKILRESLRNGKKLVNIMDLLNSSNATKLTNHLEKFLFSANQKVVLLLDGVDEVSPDYTEQILGLLKQCQAESNFAKIFVTTRPHLIKELEEVLRVKVFILLPFTEQNQVDFLTNYWINNLHLNSDITKKRCKRYVMELIRKWMNLDNDEENHFTTVPLQLRMMAEIFQQSTKSKSTDWEGCEEYISGNESEPKLTKRINISNLYKLFIEKKQDIYFYKGNPSGNTTANQALGEQFIECLVYHRSFALEVILGEEKLHLFSIYRRRTKSAESNLLKIGIVQKFHGNLHFIHRTFSDYFVAECLFSELQRNYSIEFQRFLIDTIFLHPQYNVTRIFLDNFLQNIVNTLPPDIFDKYKTFDREVSLDVYMLQSKLLHLLAEEGCVAIFQLILECMHFKIIKNKEISITNFYENDFNKNVQNDILGNTLNILQHLINQAGVNIKDEKGRTPLYFAAQSGRLEMAKFLIERGANVNRKNEIGYTALHSASSTGHLGIIKYLLEIGVDCNIRENNGLTTLHIAAQYGQLNTVKFLVEHSMDTRTTSNDGSTPLHSACANGQLDTIRYLLHIGLDCNTRNSDGFNALYVAVQYGQLNTIKFLIKYGMDIRTTGNDGSTLLHTASANGQLDTIRYLLEIGVDCNIRTNNGFTTLHVATQYGQLNTVKFFIDYGMDIRTTGNDGSTLLHTASANGQLDTIKYLLEIGVDCDARNNNGVTALYVAAQYGQLDTVKFLIEYGMDFRTTGNDGSTPLHSASANGKLDTIKYLLEIGVDCDARNNNGVTALYVAAQYGQLDTVKFLIEYGMDIRTTGNDGSTTLHSASANGKLDTIKYLLEIGVDCDARNNNGVTALYVAAQYGQLDIVKFLIEYGMDIRTTGNDGSTPLHSACANGQLDTIRYLLHIGLDCNTRNSDGFNALYVAAQYGQLNTIRFLIKYGMDIRTTGNDGSTLLHTASANGQLDTIKYLLEIGVDCDARNNNGVSALYVAAQYGQLDTVKFLIEYGMDFRTTGNDGSTPLHSASANGKLDTIKYLLEIGVDCDARNNNGVTALYVAAQYGQLDTVKFLIEYGMDIRTTGNDGSTPLHSACANGQLDTIRYLLHIGLDCNTRNSDGFNALYVAAQYGQLNTIKFLIKYGMDIRPTGKDGSTLLHTASANGQLDTIKYLLQIGVDCNIRNNYGRTALHFAVLTYHLDVVKLLVEHGVDLTIKDSKGHTALCLAVNIGHSDIVEFLTEMGSEIIK